MPSVDSNDCQNPLFKCTSTVRVGEDAASVHYCAVLNALLILDSDGNLSVHESLFGEQLATCSLPHNVKLSAISRKLIISSGDRICLRQSYGGAFFLRSALQLPIEDADNPVMLEISLSEAVTLSNCLRNIKCTDEKIKDIASKFLSQLEPYPTDGLPHKWLTIVVTLPFIHFTELFNVIHSENTVTNDSNENGVPKSCSDATQLAYTCINRLASLHNCAETLLEKWESLRKPSVSASATSTFCELTRRRTFTTWPHTGYRWVHPEAMAKAGFYHIGKNNVTMNSEVTSGKDCVMCFYCHICLVDWESTDEPWSEHERHSPNCPFINGESTVNVPLSLTLATSPATSAGSELVALGPSYSDDLFITACADFSIVVWSHAVQLQMVHKFSLRLHSTQIVDCCWDACSVAKKLKAEATEEMSITALCLIPDRNSSGIVVAAVNVGNVASCLVFLKLLSTGAAACASPSFITTDDMTELIAAPDCMLDITANSNELVDDEQEWQTALLKTTNSSSEEMMCESLCSCISIPGIEAKVSHVLCTETGGWIVAICSDMLYCYQLSTFSHYATTSINSPIVEALVIPGNNDDTSSSSIAGISEFGDFFIWRIPTLELIRGPYSPDGSRLKSLSYDRGADTLHVLSASGLVHCLELRRRINQDDSTLLTMNLDPCNPLTIKSLREMKRLMQSFPLTPRFTASVPPSWSELEPDQRQRKTPPHFHPSGGPTFTRVYRLGGENVKNHSIELIFPNSTLIAHIDVTLTFKSRPNRSVVLKLVDAMATVVCGPVNLCMFMTPSYELQTSVPMTSVCLLQNKYRVLNLVIEEAPSLAELSIAVRCWRYAAITSNRNQLDALLNNGAKYSANLLEAVLNPLQSIKNCTALLADACVIDALSLISWCAYVYGVSPDSRLVELTESLQQKLYPLLKTCFIRSNRSIAHALSRLLITIIQLHPRPDYFKTSLTKALLLCIPDAITAQSEGGLRWMYMLLSSLNDEIDIPGSINRIVSQMNQLLIPLSKYDHFETTMREKFLMYSNPFEKELFSISLPFPTAEEDSFLSRASFSGQLYHGVLDCEPLSYTCIDASDGTTISWENGMHSNSIQPVIVATGFPMDPISDNDEDVDLNSGFYGQKSYAEIANSQNSTDSAFDNIVYEENWRLTPASIHITKMVSGSRKHITLDFGRRVWLSDLAIGPCEQLASLTIDYWSESEDNDGARLATSFTIASAPLVLSDLLPAVHCRYFKLTLVGRYGMPAGKLTVPFAPILGCQCRPELGDDTDSLISTLSSQNRSAALLAESVECRYALSLDILRSAFEEYSNVSGSTEQTSRNHKRIASILSSCHNLQLQWNIVCHLKHRLSELLNTQNDEPMLNPNEDINFSEVPVNRLVVNVEYLLKFLLTCSLSNNNEAQNLLTEEQALLWFDVLCTKSSLRTSIHGAIVIFRFCKDRAWWGRFIKTVFVKYFLQSKEPEFQVKIFRTIFLITQLSFDYTDFKNIIFEFFNLLIELIPHYDNTIHMQFVYSNWRNVTLLLMFLAHIFTADFSENIETSRWSFIPNFRSSNSRNSKKNSTLDRLYSIMDTSYAQKFRVMYEKYNKVYDGIGRGKLSYKSKYNLTSEKKSLSKWKDKMVDLIDSEPKDSFTPLLPPSYNLEFSAFTLPKESCLVILSKLAGFLPFLMSSYAKDTVILLCKVLSSIALSSRPSISLFEVFNVELLQKCFTSCLRKPIHTIICHAFFALVQDLIEGELYFSGELVTDEPDAVVTNMDISSEQISKKENPTVHDNGKFAYSPKSVHSMELPQESYLELHHELPEEISDPLMISSFNFVKMLSDSDNYKPGNKLSQSLFTSNVLPLKLHPVRDRPSKTTGKIDCQVADCRINIGFFQQAERWLLALQRTSEETLSELLTKQFSEQSSKLSTYPPMTSLISKKNKKDFFSCKSFSVSSNTQDVLVQLFDVLFSAENLRIADIGSLLQMFLRLNSVNGLVNNTIAVKPLHLENILSQISKVHILDAALYESLFRLLCQLPYDTVNVNLLEKYNIFYIFLSCSFNPQPPAANQNGTILSESFSNLLERLSDLSGLEEFLLHTLINLCEPIGPIRFSYGAVDCQLRLVEWLLNEVPDMNELLAKAVEKILQIVCEALGSGPFVNLSGKSNAYSHNSVSELAYSHDCLSGKISSKRDRAPSERDLLLCKMLQLAEKYVHQGVSISPTIISRALNAANYCRLALPAHVLVAVLEENFSEKVSLGDYLISFIFAIGRTKPLELLPCLIEIINEHVTLSETLVYITYHTLSVSECFKDGKNAAEIFASLNGVSALCNSLIHRYVNDSCECDVLKDFSRIFDSNDINNDRHNVAPLGRIVCSSNAQMAAPDALIGEQPAHKRARSAVWMYQFSSEEMWCELTLTLMHLVLVDSIEIKLHATGMAGGPSIPGNVQIATYSSDQCLTLLTPPLISVHSGGVLMLRLSQPVLTCRLVLRLGRPPGGRTHSLSLSHIAVYAVTPKNGHDRILASLHIIKILELCILRSDSVTKCIIEKMLMERRLLLSCVSLLSAGVERLCSFSLYKFLLTLSKFSENLRNILTITLLECLYEKSNNSDVFGEQVMDLVYDMVNNREDTIVIMFQWLCSLVANESRSLFTPGTSNVSRCLASVLWKSQVKLSELEIKQFIQKVGINSHFSWLFCSLCEKNSTVCFMTILQTLNAPELSITTDDAKINSAAIVQSWWANLSVDALKCLACVLRSESAFSAFESLGFLTPLCALLAAHFAKKEHICTPRQAYFLLKFINSICCEPFAQQFLSSPSGSTFWVSLLQMLSTQSCSDAFEKVAIDFFVSVTRNNRAAQNLAADIVVSHVLFYETTLCAFIRRFILTVFLGEDTIFVEVVSCGAGRLNRWTRRSEHPRYQLGALTSSGFVDGDITIEEMISLVSDFTSTQPNHENEKKSRRKKKDDPSQIDDTVASSLQCLNIEPEFRQICWNGRVLPRKKRLIELGQPFLCLEIVRTTKDEELMDDIPFATNNSLVIPQAAFSAAGGLATIAANIPVLSPDLIRSISPQKLEYTTNSMASNNGSFRDWVLIDSNDAGTKLWFDMAPSCEENEPETNQSQSSLQMGYVAPHCMAIFALALQLPHYVEMFESNSRQLRRLIRCLLGVSDGREYSISLVFDKLDQLLGLYPLSTDDGLTIRRKAVKLGLVDLLIHSFGILSHSKVADKERFGFLFSESIFGNGNISNNSSTVSTAQKTSSVQQPLYWAKGTGFGTGNTQSGWDVAQVLARRVFEEEHITLLLRTLAALLASGNNIQSCSIPDGNCDFVDKLATIFSSQEIVDLLDAYLVNDSILDISRHVHLYKAILAVVTACALHPALLRLLASKRGTSSSLVEHLSSLYKCITEYTQRLEQNSKGLAVPAAQSDKDEEGEAVCLLAEDLNNAYHLVQRVVGAASISSNNSKMMNSDGSLTIESNEEYYKHVMRQLQFESFDIINKSGNLACSYIFSKQLKANSNASDSMNVKRARRLAQEAVTLSTSLPLAYCSSVFVRYDEQRLDVMKVAITGPEDTPYESGIFVFDVFFPADYPSSPLHIQLQTTGAGTIRFNPNLYNDGKVCLSILNTWHGRPEEKWNPQTSNLLQVLVSIQSLILVADPYFNEPGYERSRGTPSGQQNSDEYTANIRQATVRWAMLEHLRSPCPALKSVIQAHFYLKKQAIITQCRRWVTECDTMAADKRFGKSIQHHAVALRKYSAMVEEELNKLQSPFLAGPNADVTTEEVVMSSPPSATDEIKLNLHNSKDHVVNNT